MSFAGLDWSDQEAMGNEKIGRVTQIIGPVVDIKFQSGELPDIYNAVRIVDEDRKLATGNVDGDGEDIVLEVMHHLGDDTVRCVAMSSTEGLTRGMKAVDMGGPIEVPVGRGTLGRIFNVLGDAIDENGDVRDVAYRPIHRPAPPLLEQETSTEIFETGIKVIDLLAPYPKGGKVGLFGGAGVGKTVLIMELIHSIAMGTW